MAGGDLAALAASARLTPKRAVEVATAVFAALAAAHRVGVLHRDVKPANVLFDAAGSARLADFGVAHLGDLSATATAGVIGTLGYLSPEVARGEPATVASDVFSAGALLCTLLTGRPPAPSASGLTHAPPSTLHRDLDARHDALLAALVAEIPGDRPRSAAEAAKALGTVPWPDRLAAVPVVSVPPPPSEAPRPEEIDERLGPAEEDPLPALEAGEHGQIAWDRHTGRRVRLLPALDATLLRASLFAVGEDRHLQAVLRHDAAAGTLWLEEPPLRSGEGGAGTAHGPFAERLRGALAALHRRGFVHGRVDEAHVHETADGAPWLRFAPYAPAGASAERDRQDLERLLGRVRYGARIPLVAGRTIG